MNSWEQLEKLKTKLRKAKRRGDQFAIETIRRQIRECKDEMRLQLAESPPANIEGDFGIIGD